MKEAKLEKGWLRKQLQEAHEVVESLPLWMRCEREVGSSIGFEPFVLYAAPPTIITSVEQA